MKCQKCQKETILPFRCQHCGGQFCSEHRLPENHECPQIALARAPKREKTITIQKQKPYEYTITYIPPEPKRRIHFSNTEIRHLAIAALLVMAIGLSFYVDASMEPIYIALFTSMLTASFLLHEIAHKIAAQRGGLWAEFRLVLLGAILTLFSAFLPIFKIISPGAVMISGSTDKDGVGKISLAGPMTNIVLSTMFLIASVLLRQLIPIIVLGAFFNAWIALFNLIPFGMLDGFKIFRWNKAIWTLAFTASLVLTIISFSYYAY
jgi:Zn-dependent protease